MLTPSMSCLQKPSPIHRPAAMSNAYRSCDMPVYSVTGPLPQGSYNVSIDPFPPSSGWPYTEVQHSGSNYFGPYEGSGDLLDFSSLEAVPMESYSPASNANMALGAPTPSMRTIPVASPGSSTMGLGQLSSPQLPVVPSQSTASLSPALSSGFLSKSPRSDKTDNERSRRRSTSAPEGRNKPRRRTHNAIEKRYRTRLNDKITELRDHVPGLGGQPAEGSGEYPSGMTTGEPNPQKINKAHILEKATEYIQHLETCNRQLQTQLVQNQQALRRAGEVYGSVPAHMGPSDPVKTSRRSHPVPYNG